MALYGSFLELIGGAPTVALKAMEAFYACGGRLYGKCEFLNPSGSVKDRPISEMIYGALSEGRLTRDGAVICPSAGNSAISSAMVCCRLGIRCVIITQSPLPEETSLRLKAYGAEAMISRSPGMEAVEEAAKRLAATIPGGFILDQFCDPSGPLAHRKTGEEILRDLPEVDYVISGIGSGATVTGCGEVIKMHRPECKIIGVEPSDSPVISGGMASPHPLTGIGAGFVPEVLNGYILDSVVKVTVPDAYEASSRLARLEGMLCGPSSGAALAAGLYIASRPEAEGKNILVVLPDRGERYLDRGIYNG